METVLLATDTPASLAIAVEAAARALAAGEPVALPTETVYGLAADALRPDAVVKIFEAKERPFFDPLIVHLPGREWLERVAAIPVESRALVEALLAKFWPGPLTLVLPRREIVPDVVTAGLETVAVRMSAHPVFRAVIERFGRISPTAAEHVRSELDGRIPLIVDGGATEHGVESTIVKVEGAAMEVLRAGPIAGEDLVGVWVELVRTRNPQPDQEEATRVFSKVGASACWMPRNVQTTMIEAPGQLKSHYAPRTRLLLLRAGQHVRLMAGRTGYLAWSDDERARGDGCARCEVLSPSGDLREAAATLFAKLRRLDEAGLDLILAEPVPEHGLGIAIMDRLRKAAAHHV